MPITNIDIEKIIEEAQDIMRKLRWEATQQAENWKKYPHRTRDVDKQIKQLEENWKVLEDNYTNLLVNQKPDNLPIDWEKQLADKKELKTRIITIQNELGKVKRERDQQPNITLEEYEKLQNNQKPIDLPSDWKQQIAEKNRYLQERDARPDITIENYKHLLDNQKPVDYEDIKDKLNEWENGLRGQTLEQIQTKLNRISELEIRPTSEQSSKLTEENSQLRQQIDGFRQQLTSFKTALPSLFKEEGKINEESLTLLTNILVGVEELENGEEESVTIPADENFFYQLAKKSEDDEMDSESDSEEKEWLENELKKEKWINDGLRKKIVSLEATEKERNDQLRQLKEKEQQIGSEMKTELELIIRTTDFPSGLSSERLTNVLTRLREMKSWLISGTNEQQKFIKEESSRVKEVLNKLKLEEQRRNTKQIIADSLADKEKKTLKKRIEVNDQELPEERYRSYSRTLYQMNDLVEIIEFEKEILQVIAEQKQGYQTIMEILAWGKKTINDKNFKRAEKARRFLLEFRKLQVRQGDNNSDGYSIFRKKSGQFHELIGQLDSFLQEQEQTTAQIVQSDK